MTEDRAAASLEDHEAPEQIRATARICGKCREPRRVDASSEEDYDYHLHAQILEACEQEEMEPVSLRRADKFKNIAAHADDEAEVETTPPSMACLHTARMRIWQQGQGAKGA